MNRTERLAKMLFAGLLLVIVLGGAAFRGRDVTNLPFAPAIHEDIPSLQSLTCGIERWAIKTGTDSDAKSINLSSSTPTTLVALINLTVPPSLPDDKRISPTEDTVWVITATLTGFKIEDDHDYHLVLSDEKKQTMIAEIPDPKCVGTTSAFTAAITNARSKFDNQFSGPTKPSSSFRILKDGLPVRITGVGFFDKLHGQRGVAPNGIELHPVVDIVFNPTSLTTPLTPTLPSMSDVNEVKWEYDLITAKSAEELRDALTPMGEEGWELVNVMLDPKRPDAYVAYLKRQKE